MGPTLQPNLQLLYNDARLLALLEALDELHTAASENSLNAACTLSKTELKAWLRDVIYTAQETIGELECQNVAQEPVLNLVRKSS
jgi:hypothetical protein